MKKYHNNSNNFIFKPKNSKVNRFAFHEDYGLPTIEEEAEALGTSLADKDVLFMCNHGMPRHGGR